VKKAFKWMGGAFVALVIIIRLFVWSGGLDALSESASGAAYEQEMERSSGRPMVCQRTQHSGTCCQVDVDGRFVPGRATYCDHR
jgi:hypothetical protein